MIDMARWAVALGLGFGSFQFTNLLIERKLYWKVRNSQKMD